MDRFLTTIGSKTKTKAQEKGGKSGTPALKMAEPADKASGAASPPQDEQDY